MSKFDEAVKVILSHEGTDKLFWVDDPDDLGGETVWGISMLMIKSEGITPRDLGLNIDEFTPGCLRHVSKEKCAELYRRFFWDKYNYDNIDSQILATKVFDAAVNCGPSRAATFAQKTANKLGAKLVVDGALGPKTFAAINVLDRKDFLVTYCGVMLEYYRAIVVARPRNAKFLNNWTRRSQWGMSLINELSK